MASLATDLLRIVARAFYPTEHVLVIEALIIHSTLSDADLAFVLGMQPKPLRKLCGRLKEDGLLSIQTRSERRTDGSGGYHFGGGGGTSQFGKERLTNKDWYYLNFHRAIDSIKYRMHKLNKHVESLGAPTTEKKDLSCPQCKSQWTELEVMHKMDFTTGLFHCARCGHSLDPVEEDERANENEMMKRLNSQLEKLLRLMQQIDSTTVPENDFDTALSKQKPVVRGDAHPGQASRTEIVDLPKYNLQSSKGLDIIPEKIAVQLQNDEDVKRANAEAEAKERREREARQNALPDWIAKSTVSGEITTVGAKEDRERRAREAHTGGAVKAEEDGEEKKAALGGEDDVMAAYWAEMAKAQAAEAAQQAAEDEEEDEDDEDDFEDVDVGGAKPLPVASGALAGNGVNAVGSGIATGVSTPALESSNATDDEREVKRVRLDLPAAASSAIANGEAKANGAAAEGTPAASDEDEDELEFENV